MCIGFQAQNSVLSFLSCDLIVELIQRGLKLLLCMVMRSDPKGLTVASTHHVLSRLLIKLHLFFKLFFLDEGLFIPHAPGESRVCVSHVIV